MASTTKSHGTSSVIAAAPVPALLATGPATYCWWKFDEVVGTGSPAYDTGAGGVGAEANDFGNVNTVMAATVAPLHIVNDHARGFPAAGAFLSTGVKTALALADYFSISVWVKPAAFDAHRGVVSRLDTSTGRGWNIFISGPPTPGVVYFNVMNGPGTSAYAGGGTPLTLNVWSHIACIMGGGVRFVYINGVVQGVSNSSPMLPGLSTTEFQIGNWAEDLLSPFYGAMDDLRHYNSQLTLGNIQTLAYGLDPVNVTIFNRTHTTDSKLRGTIAKTHTTSSVLLKTITKTHTTDSRLRTTVTKTHTTDTWLRTTATKTHATDAALRATATRIYTTDSLLQKTSTKTYTTDTSLKALPSVFAQFVQRDNWRNGTWIGQYGSQGYAVFFSYQNDVMPPGVSYTRAGGTDDWWVTPGTYTDPRLPQVPNNPTQTVGSVYYAYQTTKTSTTFLFDDGLAHALSIFCLNYDAPARRQRIEVYNADTNALLDTQEVGDFYTSSIYMTWNVQGHIRFDVVLEVQSAMSTALFVDPPMSIGAKTHYASTQTIGLPVTVVRTHITDALSRGTIFKPHNTDVWSCKTLTKAHYTDAWSCKTVTKAHYTDILRQATATRAHLTDALVRLTVAATHTADALLRGTATRAHFTDALVHTTVTRTHFTDTRSRATVLKAHFTDAWSHSTVTRTHDTSAVVRTTVSTTHGTDTSLAITNHLISYWKLDEAGTGQVAIDSMPLGANATDVLGTTVPSAPAPLHFTNPSGRTLPGDGTYLDTGVQPAHSFTQNFTIAGWVRPAVVDVAVVVSHMPNPLNRGWGLVLLNDATPALYACDAAGAHAVYAYGNQAPVGVWMHLAGVYYDNNTMGLFVNGRKFPANASIDPSPDLPTYIGKWCSGAPYYGASSNADFDDIRIYDIALTDAQISSLAAGIRDPLAVTVATRTHGTDAALVIPPTTVTTTHTTDASISALPSVFAQFVQRDNWRNGAWINHYGVQGYSLFRNGIPYALPPESTIPDVMPPGVTYTMYAAYDQGLDPAVYTDPRLLQDPTRPGYTTKAIYYNGDPSRYAVFRFDDGLSHAVSLYQLDYDHEHARYTITVYDDATGTLLDGPREVGDYETTGVYLTWNVRGHIRFYSTPEVAYSYTSALFVDPPRSVGAQTHTTDTALLGAPVTVTKTHTTDALLRGTVTKTHGTDTAIFAPIVTSAAFVQRDNWRNGINWIGQYGKQGYSIFSAGDQNPDVLPSGVTYTATGGSYDVYDLPGVYTEPRYLMLPSDHTKSMGGVYYSYGTESFTFLFDDSLRHALTFYGFNEVGTGSHFTINVYDNDTNALLDGPRDTGDYFTTGIYRTWNVSGHVRFDFTAVVSYATESAFFIDAPMAIGSKTHQTDASVAVPPLTVTITHGTDTSIAPAAPPTSVAEFVQRDNWLGGKWIGTYGFQGYAVFLTGTPTVLPPQVSYKVAGGRYDCWLPPGTYTDPRLPQVPGQPDKTEAAVYHTEETECFFFNFDDGSMHAVSIFSLDYDQGDLRHQIEVYDNNTNALLDGPRDVGDQYTNSVYMTWNVSGHVRFELVTDVENAVATAWFIDPRMSIGGVAHGTDAWISGTATVTKTHKTDSLIAGLGVGIVGSRSRSQRVGTRTLAFGDQL